MTQIMRDIMSRISRFLSRTAFVTALVVTSSLSPAADPPAGAVIFDMDTIRHQPTVWFGKCSDRTHLASRGHTVVGETVLQSIVK